MGFLARAIMRQKEQVPAVVGWPQVSQGSRLAWSMSAMAMFEEAAAAFFVFLKTPNKNDVSCQAIPFLIGSAHPYTLTFSHLWPWAILQPDNQSGSRRHRQ